MTARDNDERAFDGELTSIAVILTHTECSDAMGYFQAALVKAGMAQPGPKITQQDRAILEWARALLTHLLRADLFLSLKVQRDKLKQYQKRVCLTEPLKGRLSGSLMVSS